MDVNMALSSTAQSWTIGRLGAFCSLRSWRELGEMLAVLKILLDERRGDQQEEQLVKVWRPPQFRLLCHV